jgi:hypothetical protein
MEDVVGGACSTHGDKKCVLIFRWQTWSEETTRKTWDRREDNMKVDQREIDFEGVDCTYSSGLG